MPSRFSGAIAPFKAVVWLRPEVELPANDLGYKKGYALDLPPMPSHHLDGLLRQAAIASISTYQRTLSPHKGFACPHRLLYGGASCADYAKQLLHRQSFKRAIGHLPQRFRACYQASQTLQLQANRPRRSGFGCVVIPCCLPL
ncbi:MAG: membrane protein insertion efficiency factor YidD [Almyronema sp.]